MRSNHSFKQSLFTFALAVLIAGPCLAQGSGDALERARWLLSENYVDSASAVLGAAIMRDSTDSALWQLKSETHLASSDTSGAISALRRAFDLRPDHVGIRATLLRLLLSTGQSATALERIRLTLPRHRPRSADALYLWGQVFEANSLADSASRFYRQALDLLTRGDMPLTPLPVGSKINTVEVTAPDGDVRRLRPGTSTIVVFWASWSELSEQALEDIARQKKRSAMTWRLVPINLDSNTWQQESAREIVNRARALGCNDTVYFDDNSSLARAWAIDRVPCCITLEYGGTVTDIVHGWDSSASRRLLSGALGSLSDSVTIERAAPDTVRGRSNNLRALARREWTTGQSRHAMHHIDLAVRADPSFDLPLADLVAYRWIRGDAIGARHALSRFPTEEGTSAWPVILAAHSSAAQGDPVGAVDGLLDFDAGDRQESGQFYASLALLAARAGRFKLAADAYDKIRSLCRFNEMVPEIEARLAEQTDTLQATRLWRQAVSRRLSTQSQ